MTVETEKHPVTNVSPGSERTRRSRLHRTVAIAAVSVVAMFTLASCITEQQTQLQSWVNYDRANNKLKPLADYDPADTKAQNWAQHLANRWDTLRRTGSTDNPLVHSNLTDGYSKGQWCNLGENVGMRSPAKGETLNQSVAYSEAAYMKSPPHKANILGRQFTHIGTGVAVAKDGRVFTVEEFFRPPVNGRC